MCDFLPYLITQYFGDESHNFRSWRTHFLDLKSKFVQSSKLIEAINSWSRQWKEYWKPHLCFDIVYESW